MNRIWSLYKVTFSLWSLHPRRRLNPSFFNFILFKKAGGSLGSRPPPPVSRILLQPYIAAIQKGRPLLLVSGILDFCLCKPNQKSGEYLSSLALLLCLSRPPASDLGQIWAQAIVICKKRCCLSSHHIRLASRWSVCRVDLRCVEPWFSAESLFS